MRSRQKYLVFFHSIIFLLVMTVMSSCSSDDKNARELYFIGDSHIELWDLSNSFPTYIVHNDGISGSGIAYIEESAGRYAGKEVVVITGTNDLQHFTQDFEEEYVVRYVKAIEELGAARLYLFSILPRSAELFGPNVSNEKIKRMNNKIKQAIHKKPIVYVDVCDMLIKDGVINPLYTCDGLHLSQEGYEVITEQLKNKL